MQSHRHSLTFRALAYVVIWLVGVPSESLALALRQVSRNPQRTSALEGGARKSEIDLAPAHPPHRAIGNVSRQPQLPKFSAEPTDRELFEARVFFEPLIPSGAAVTLADAKESSRLAEALTEYLQMGGGENVTPILNFLDAHPRSRWRGSLWTNMGIVYRRTGYFTRALEAFDTAWKVLVSESESRVRLIADRALAESLELNARLGRSDVLEALLGETNGREVRGSATEKISGARQGLWLMTNKPEEAFRCGPMALDRLLAFGNPSYELDARIANARSTSRGMSLQQVQHLSDELGMGLQMAKREPGAPFVTPAVVHWKAGHFAALPARAGERFMVEDPTFGDRVWISRRALTHESSGYFLVPEGDLPDGWRRVSADEAGTIWGKGNTHGQDPQAIRSCDFKDGGDGCASGACSSPGLASYRFHSMMVSLNITDAPVGYVPALGPPVEFLMTYNQRESFQPMAFAYSNLGPKWTFDWMSYVEDDPADPQQTVHLYARGGGQETYIFDPVEGAFEPQLTSRAELSRLSDAPVRYQRTLPDGSRETFAVADGASSFPRRVFLSEWVDPQGNALTFHYDGLKLTSVEDATGLVTRLLYDAPEDAFKVTGVRDPFGRLASFEYNPMGQLFKITDVVGLSSEFEYASGDFVAAMRTPYGRTEFFAGERVGLTGFGVDRWLEAVDPLGARERLEFLMEFPGVAPREPETVTPDLPWVLNGSLQYRNSFYWSKLAMDRHPGDYSQASITHWLKNGGAGELSLTSGVKESVKRPLEHRIWFDYPGKIQVHRGHRTEPAAVATVLEDGTEQVVYFDYNDKGHVTRFTDPVGRDVRFEYADNQIDLERVLQRDGAGYALLGSATYNDQHLPIEVTDPSGQRSVLSYTARGQLETVTNARGDVSRFDYRPDQTLERVSRLGTGAVMDIAWDAFVRVRTMTAEDRTLSFDYDPLDRLTRTTFPDGTYEEVTYQRLDPESFRDRRGGMSRFFYDDLGRAVAYRDPSGRTVTQEWCDCGALEAVVDGEGNRTRWSRDVSGRVTEEVGADGSITRYFYDTATGRLEEYVDASGARRLYEYFPDDTLKRVRVVDVSGAALLPAVSFEYDPDYRRLESSTDDAGTTMYLYNPVASPPALGAGRLRSVDGPRPNDTIAYEYDRLGRTNAIDVAGSERRVVHDALGRIEQHSNSLGTFDYLYDGVSARPRAATGPNGTTRFDYFDAAGVDRVKTISHELENLSKVATYAYDYDADGNVTTWLVASGASPAERYRFDYDRARQLSRAVLESTDPTPVFLKRFAYDYDAGGNRITEQIDDAPLASKHGSMNELTSVGPGGTLAFAGTLSEPATVTVSARTVTAGPETVFRGVAAVVPGVNHVQVTATDVNENATTETYEVDVSGTGSTFTYDGNGNLRSDGERTYEWDALDQLVAVEKGPHRSEFFHDGLGRRVGIQEMYEGVVQSDRRFLWCGDAICEERDATGQTVKRFYPQGVEASDSGYFYARDHLGSVRELTDRDGNLRASYDYDPWGRRTKRAGDVDADEGYTGHFTHAGTELTLAPYRAYDPNLGRWISRDPIGLAGGMNLYGYAANTPVNAVDPYGTSPTLIAGAAGAALGGAIGAGAAWWNGGSGTDILTAAGQGALLGGLTGLTAGYASTALGGWLGGGFWGGAAAGAGGAAAGDIIGQAFGYVVGWQCGFSFTQLFVSTAFGGAFGGFAGRFGAKPPANPDVYEVLSQQSIRGASRSSHRASANRGFLSDLKRDGRLRSGFDDLLNANVVDHMRSGKSGLRNPPGTVWHHPANDPSSAQLLRSNVHTDAGNQSLLHPDGSGGFANYYGRR